MSPSFNWRPLWFDIQSQDEAARALAVTSWTMAGNFIFCWGLAAASSFDPMWGVLLLVALLASH